tara:strand:+ start:339 stop:617 length:279 start_codon:yes stop_codon:yes gene_type:complete
MTIYRLTQTSVDTQNNYSEWETKGAYFSRMVDAISLMTRDYQNITNERMSWEEYAEEMIEFKGLYITKTFYNIDDVEKDVMLSLKIEKIEVS